MDSEIHILKKERKNTSKKNQVLDTTTFFYDDKGKILDKIDNAKTVSINTTPKKNIKLKLKEKKIALEMISILSEKKDVLPHENFEIVYDYIFNMINHDFI